MRKRIFTICAFFGYSVVFWGSLPFVKIGIAAIKAFRWADKGTSRIFSEWGAK